MVAHNHTEELGFEPMPVKLVCSVPGHLHMQHICPHIYCTQVMVTILTCSHIPALSLLSLEGPDSPEWGLGERVPFALSK